MDRFRDSLTGFLGFGANGPAHKYETWEECYWANVFVVWSWKALLHWCRQEIAARGDQHLFDYGNECFQWGDSNRSEVAGTLLFHVIVGSSPSDRFPVSEGGVSFDIEGPNSGRAFIVKYAIEYVGPARLVNFIKLGKLE